MYKTGHLYRRIVDGNCQQNRKNTQLCVTTVKNYGTLSAGFANTSSIQNGGRDRDPSVFLPLSVVYIATPKLSLFYRCSA